MSHPKIRNFLNVLLGVQFEVYIKMRSIKTVKSKKRTLIRFRAYKKRNEKRNLIDKCININRVRLIINGEYCY
jgi:hypothetical protein